MVRDNNIFMVVIGFVITAFLLVGQSYILTDSSSVESISVLGKSEISVAPDVAFIYISINTKNENANNAQSENSVLGDKVILALNDAGVLAGDIETLNFRLNEISDYSYDSNTRIGEVKSEPIKESFFEAVHSLKVKTSELELVGELVSVAILAGANGVSKIEYSLSDELEMSVRAEALEKAIVVGREKALSMVNTLSLELGDVISVIENNYYFSPYSFSANIKSSSFDSGKSNNLNFVTPQDVKVTSSVSLEFEFE